MTEALVGQLSDFIRELGWKPLTEATVEAAIPLEMRDAVGVYMLGRRMPHGVIREVYLGQSSATLFERLTRHAKNVRHRSGLHTDDVFFRAAGIVIFNSVDMETGLLQIFQTKWSEINTLSGWNGSGFGSNDTGGGRDNQAPSKFDRRFPINIFQDLDKTLAMPKARVPMTARIALHLLSTAVPYTVRIAKPQRQHIDLQKIVPPFPAEVTNAHDACKHILATLGAPWIGQVFPVRIVLDRMDSPAGVVADPENWPNLSGDAPYVIITP
jgi:hypothetical protein